MPLQLPITPVFFLILAILSTFGPLSLHQVVHGQATDDLTLDEQPFNPFLEEEEEAEPSLINIDRADGDVELYVLGSWLASTRIAGGLALHPPLPDSGRRVTFPYQYPGFETEPFSQTLDIILSLWLYNRYFFEAGFADDAPDNSFSAGYVAVEDELVQELVIGNVPLSIDRYPYQYTGSPGARAGSTPRPGAVVRLQTARTYHELLLQLENSRPETRRFSGGGLLEELRLRPEDYRRQGIYVLPHAPVRDLTVYVQDREGSVEIASMAASEEGPRRFRALDAEAGDYVVDLINGVIRLGAAIPRDVTIAAAYVPDSDEGQVTDLDEERTPTTEKIPFPLIGDGNVTQFNDTYGDIDRYRLRVISGTGSGKRGVFLDVPGRYSPFAAANHYDLPPESRTAVQDGTARIRLVRRGTRTPAENEGAFFLEPVAQGTLLQVVGRHDQGATSGRPAPADRDWKYPFAGRAPQAAHAAMYGPRSHPRENVSDVDILVEYRSGETGLFLDGNVVPGTVSVTRNGRPLPGAEIDYGTGEIVLPETVRTDTDATIDVRYRVYSPDAGTGDIVAISGNRWQVSDSLLLTMAAGVRWTMAEDQYSRVLEEHPGQVTASVGLEHRGEHLSIDAAAAVQLYQPDTTGYMRLFGGEPETFTISPRATTVFPSSVPITPADVDPFDPTRRSVAPYRDYWSTDVLGNVALEPYTATVQADPDREGARMGPYLARSTDNAYSGTVGILEWEDLGPGEWVGAQVRVTSTPADLRDARRVTIRYRVESDETDTELLVQLGAIEEDLDGDGRAARGRSAVDPTFEFVFPSGHPLEGRVRRVGPDAPGLAAPHREDPRRDNVLRQEVSESVLTLSGIETVDTDGNWRIDTITLSRDEAERLSDLRAVRFLVRNPAPDGTSDPRSGRLLIGSVDIERSGNATVTAGRERNARASVASDPGRSDSDIRPLRDAWPIVRNRFNPDEADQPVLELTWNGGVGPDKVEAAFGIPDFSPDRYGTLVFYALLQTPDPPTTVTLTLAPYPGAPPSQSIVVELPASVLHAQEWREVRVNLETGTVTVNGATQDNTIPIPAARLPRSSVTILRHGTLTVDGVTEEGALYFDELHGADPQAGTAAAGRIGAVWRTDLIGGRLTVEQDLSVQSTGFRSTETSGDAAGAVSGRSRAGFRRNRFLVAAEGSYRFEENDTAVGALGHDVAIPIGRADLLDLLLEDEFLRDFDPRMPLINRRTALSLGNGRIGRYRAAHGHRVDQRETQLRWTGQFTFPQAGPLGLSVESRAELRDLDQVIKNTDYVDSWLEAGQHIIPQGRDDLAGRQERRLDARTLLTLSRWRLDLSGGWRNRSDTAGTQENVAALETALPLEFTPPGARMWSLTPAYRRSWRTTDRDESRYFDDDLDIWGSAIADDPALFTALPLAELFLPLERDTLPSFRETRLYDAEARLRFSRAFASRPEDLFVPSNAEALLRRSSSREADTLTDRRTWQLTLTAVAINLFGLEGSTPRATWYRSDEFRNRLLLAVTEQVPGNITQWRAELRNDTLLLGLEENELTLNGRIEVTGGAGATGRTEITGGGSYVRRRPGYPPLPVLERLDTTPYYRHTERLEVTLSLEENELRESEIRVGHETALVVGPNGEFRLFGDLGWLVNPAEYDRGALHLIGFQAGIEGVLKY